MNADSLLIDQFAEKLASAYEYMYGKDFPSNQNIGRMKEVLVHCARNAAELVSVKADTPYHDLEHLIDVTLTTQEILLGKHTIEKVKPDDWFSTILAAVYHDIGYIPDLFSDDPAINGITGASYSKEHVTRSMRYVAERFGKSDIIDSSKVVALIEYTSVPVIKAEDTTSYGGLLRAADYIGQLSNLDIRRRNLSLLHEFEESGLAKKRGFRTVGDVIADVPSFYETQVKALIGPAMKYLERTRSGFEKIRAFYGALKMCELYRDDSKAEGEKK